MYHMGRFDLLKIGQSRLVVSDELRRSANRAAICKASRESLEWFDFMVLLADLPQINIPTTGEDPLFPLLLSITRTDGFVLNDLSNR